MADERIAHPESGNVIILVLMAIVLIALVTVAIRQGSEGTSDVDRESLIMNLSKVRQQASEFERGVAFIINNGASETDIRFAYADAPSDYGDITATPQFQMFSPQGGGAAYHKPPDGVNDGSAWEFYGNTALPDVGSDKPELVAVLPNVTDDFCKKTNADEGYAASATLTDSATCINTGATARFNDTVQYDDSGTNTVDTATFPSGKPILEGCITCADGSRHFFHVLHAR
jgi:hypothetical protein